MTYLGYDPRGRSEAGRGDEGKRAHQITIAIKRDGFLPDDSTRPVIQRVIARMRQEGIEPDFFGEDVAAIPVPRSTPQVESALWVPLQICKAMLDQGMVGSIWPCVKRAIPVAKSSTAGQGARPDASKHFDSLSLDLQYSPSALNRILLVDDVVTKGATLAGVHERVRERYPHADIRAFAIVRTMGLGNFERAKCPLAGRIRCSYGDANRLP